MVQFSYSIKRNVNMATDAIMWSDLVRFRPTGQYFARICRPARNSDRNDRSFGLRSRQHANVFIVVHVRFELRAHVDQPGSGDYS